MSGHISFMVPLWILCPSPSDAPQVPGQSQCFACAPPLMVASGIDEKSIKRVRLKARAAADGSGKRVCGVAADDHGCCCGAACAEHSQVPAPFWRGARMRPLFLLLTGRQVASFLGYNALKNYFPMTDQKPNPHCTNAWCVQRQKEYQVRSVSLGPAHATNSGMAGGQPQVRRAGAEGGGAAPRGRK